MKPAAQTAHLFFSNAQIQSQKIKELFLSTLTIILINLLYLTKFSQV
jgi:hypothetical protein